MPDTDDSFPPEGYDRLNVGELTAALREHLEQRVPRAEASRWAPLGGTRPYERVDDYNNGREAALDRAVELLVPLLTELRAVDDTAATYRDAFELLADAGAADVDEPAPSVEHDPEARAAYVRLRNPTGPLRQRALTDSVILDVDDDGVAGVEVLGVDWSAPHSPA